MSDTLRHALAALDATTRATAAALRSALLDLDAPAHAAGAVSRVHHLAETLSSSAARLARHAAARPVAPVDEGPEIVLADLAAFIRLAQGVDVECSICGGMRPATGAVGA